MNSTTSGIDYTEWTQTQWERNCQLSAAVIVFIEYVLQLTNEYDLFWAKKWTLAKCLFLWSRYYSLGYNIANAVVFMQYNASVAVRTNFFHWQNGGAILQYITTQIILSLRIYAMYGRSKKVLAFLTFMVLAEIAAMVVLFEVPKAGLVGTNNPSLDLFICADGDPPHVHWEAYVPVITLITESILLSFAVNKALQQYMSGTPGGRILPKLTRESVFFFCAIVGVHVANLTIWMINTVGFLVAPSIISPDIFSFQLTVNELVTGFSFAIPAVLANRLLISVRQHVGTTETTGTSMLETVPLGFVNRSGNSNNRTESDTYFDSMANSTYQVHTIGSGDGV
ncbi:hypothetical protein FB45DRAFT_843411 [Roridomyces roridus]|uniref:DUF6533 domain-containing protein n=1 Tax=Roridomyces roridus TaxID=1738132 RepID=A0AAD7B745_9AGAR|nr:hypothetical protein FB45DRAFT_843411 [Roridomyces roridus]